MTNDWSVPPQPPQTWFSRNWKWVAPLGCLALIVLAGCFVAGVFFAVFGAMRSSDVFKESLVRAQANPVLREKLGTPIEAGWLVSGSINVSGPGGSADISIPIHGPRGKADLYVTAKKSAGQWTFTTLVAQLEGAPDRIDLLESPPGHAR